MLTIQEKMATLKLSLGFAEGGCLSCIDDKPPAFFPSIRASADWHQGVIERHSTGVEGLVRTLEIIGLEGSEVDALLNEKLRRETRFTQGEVGACVTVKEFLPIIEELLMRKFPS